MYKEITKIDSYWYGEEKDNFISKINDIERIANEQKYLFMIFELMIILSEKEFYKKVYNFAKNLLKEVDMY